MTLYRWIKDGKLYIIYFVNGGQYGYTGKWFNAIPYKHDGKSMKISSSEMGQFIPVADSPRVR